MPSGTARRSSGGGGTRTGRVRGCSCWTKAAALTEDLCGSVPARVAERRKCCVNAPSCALSSACQEGEARVSIGQLIRLDPAAIRGEGGGGEGGGGHGARACSSTSFCSWTEALASSSRLSIRST